MEAPSSIRKWHLGYLLFIVIPLVVSPLAAVDAHEMPKQTVFIWILGVWLAVGALFAMWQKKITVRLHTPTTILLGAWAGSFVFSTIFSIAPVESFWGTSERLQGLFIHFFYGLHFLICLSIFRDEKIRRIFWGSTAIAGSIVSVYAILQWGFFNSAAYSPLLSFGRRAIATLGSPTALGQFLIFPIFAGAYFFRFSKKRLAANLLSGFAIAVMLAGLAASQNRASLLGIGAAAALLFFIRLKKNKHRLLVAGSILIAAAAAVFFLNSDGRSLGTRAVLWKTSLTAAREAPFAGSGPETMQLTLQKVMPRELYDFERITDIADRTHNVFLDALLTRGAFGAALLLITLGALSALARKINSRGGALAAAGLAAYFISIQFGFSSATHILFLLAFLAIFLNETVRFRTITVRLFAAEKGALFAAALFIALSGMSISARLYTSNVVFARGLDDYFQSEQLGLETFNAAVELAPQYAGPYRSIFILMDEHLRKSPEARVLLQQYASKMERITNSGFHSHLARAELADAEKNYAAAAEHFGAAARQAPQWSVIWSEWARSYDRRGDAEKTAEKLERVIEIAPPYWRWERDSPALSPADREKARIFRISNSSFYETLELLAASYEKLGRGAEAEELKKYF